MMILLIKLILTYLFVKLIKNFYKKIVLFDFNEVILVQFF